MTTIVDQNEAKPTKYFSKNCNISHMFFDWICIVFFWTLYFEKSFTDVLADFIISNSSLGLVIECTMYMMNQVAKKKCENEEIILTFTKG